jgi:pimeloyl-ACP methyl ester carboxylesterase
MGLVLASWVSSAGAGTSIEFPFNDDTLLMRPQKDGGLVYVPDSLSRGKSAPLVVFLHGINDRQGVHLWMGSPIGPFDLRTSWDTWIADGQARPALLAAPSQTRQAAAAATLWTDFDLEQFVDATDEVLGSMASVDRSRVLLVGHSGAGCNKTGGLASAIASPGGIHPLGIVAIDICMEEDSAATLALAPPEVPVAVYWQTSWLRPFGEFRSAFDVLRGPPSARDIIQEVAIADRDAHNAIVKVALPRALALFLPQSPR